MEALFGELHLLSILRSKAMSNYKKFLLKCCLFGILSAATVLTGEYVIRRYVDNPYKYKHEWMTRNASRVEILILGSSHTYYGINPGCFSPQKAFNLANSSQLLHYDYLLLTKYARQYQNLSTVILPISYHTFFDPEYEDSETEWIYATNYKIYMDIDVHSDFSKYNFEFSRPSIYSGKLKSLVHGHGLLYDSLGRGMDYPLENKAEGWEEEAVNTASRHTNTDSKYTSGHIAYAHKIADFCRQRNIELILITTPTWHTYYEHLDARQVASTDSIAKTLQKKYGLRYFNYLTDERFTAEDFYDGDHLSSDIGASKFTRIFIHDMNTLPKAVYRVNTNSLQKMSR